MFRVRVSKDRPIGRENLQQGVGGRKLCPEYWVPGKKQSLISLWVFSLSFPRLERFPHCHRLSHSLPTGATTAVEVGSQHLSH